MNSKLLITGAYGYIGARLAAFLHQKGYDICLGVRKAQKTSTILDQLETRVFDLLNPSTFINALKDISVVIHLASLNEIESAYDPDLAIQVNTLGTYRLAHAAKNVGVQRFIYFSTAHIYGAPLCGTITEYVLPKPIHPYAITHRAAEDYVYAMHRNQEMEGVIIRLSNSFGYPLYKDVHRWTLVVNDLCRQIFEKGQIVLKTSGIQKRDFIAMEDVCRAVDHLINLDKDKLQDGIFNLGAQSMSIAKMADLIASLCQKEFKFIPPIMKPESLSTDVSSDLTYSIHKLEKTGFDLKNPVEYEIIRTLSLCREWFGKV